MQWVIFGTGGQGREAMEVLQRDYRRKSSTFIFCEDSPTSNKINGVDVISIEKLLAIKNEHTRIHVAIGNPQNRFEISSRMRTHNIKTFELISKLSSISPHSNINASCYVSDFSIVGPNTEIGEGVLINYCASISHDVKIGNYVTVCPGVNINGYVTIEDFTFIGSNTVIINGEKNSPIKIGNNSIIGAGSVVTKNIDSKKTVFGNPAKNRTI